MKRGQATNREIGLASALIILLVVYLYLNTPYTPVPTVQTFYGVCEFHGNFSCYQPLALRRDGILDISLVQNTGKLINITSFVCTSRIGNPSVMPLLSNPVLITNGERNYIAGGNSGNIVICTGQDGWSVPNASVGDIYYGNMYVTYTEVKTGAVKFVNGTLVIRYS